MERKDVLKIVDHTLLSQNATWDDIRQILDDAMRYEAASACIPAAYVKQAEEYAGADYRSVRSLVFQTDIIPQPLKSMRQKMPLQTGRKKSIWSSISAI